MKSKTSNGKALTKKVSNHFYRPSYPRLKGDDLSKAIDEAHKDPDFMEEIKKFIKVTTN